MVGRILEMLLEMGKAGLWTQVDLADTRMEWIVRLELLRRIQTIL